MVPELLGNSPVCTYLLTIRILGFQMPTAAPTIATTTAPTTASDFSVASQGGTQIIKLVSIAFIL